MNIRDDFTLRLLADSGIGDGMRVLDVGCGTGDLSIMAAKLLGKAGKVVGVDIAENPLSIAKKAAQEQALSNVEFLQADILNLPDNIGMFDAIIGRRVLMYQRDAGQSVDRLLPRLNVGGRMIFQESDCMAASLCPESLPLHAKVQAWIWDTVAKEGGNVHMGGQLYALMKNAGLRVYHLRSEAILHTQETGSDLGWVTKMMLPRIVQYGIAAAEEIDIDTLEERLKVELGVSMMPFIRDMAFGICAKLL